MEGNLRGARNLVAPLTTANLKRATSSAASYGGRDRFIYDGWDSSPSQKPQRVLHAQASSPTMGRDFNQGHWRGHSETQIPERPHTAMERTNSPIRAVGRIPVKASDEQWTNTLRGSRSYDSLGNGAMGMPNGAERVRNRSSPDSTLEPLVEDDGAYYHATTRDESISNDSQDGLGVYRSPSRTDDLREQMSSLKGKISTLRERAREDSLRRRSMQSLREPSPLNNAEVAAPEFFYTSSQAYGSPVLDTNAGVGFPPQNDRPASPNSAQRISDSTHVVTGSRNAFAEQAMRQHQNQQQQHNTDGSSRRNSMKREKQKRQLSHSRTPSGTAIVQSSKHRYSHHQPKNVGSMPGAFIEDVDVDKPDGSNSDSLADRKFSHSRSNSYDSQDSRAGASIYEDAEEDVAPQPSVVAHEDREDAFDYKHFFLHSAMATYGIDGSASPSEGSVSSVETARPVGDVNGDEDSYDDSALGLFAPPTPETPEKLREIERKLHQRALSNESVSTVATFATATEGRDSPQPSSRRSSGVADWPIPRQQPESTHQRSNSRPSTAIPIKRQQAALSDSSSERADSGIGGMPRRPLSSHDTTKRSTLPSLNSKSSMSVSTPRHPISPPMSPRSVLPQDPATVAVNALLDSAGNGRQLGLKDKATLFGVVESLRKTCARLQEESDDNGPVSRTLRKRLDDARKALEGS